MQDVLNMFGKIMRSSQRIMNRREFWARVLAIFLKDAHGHRWRYISTFEMWNEWGDAFYKCEVCGVIRACSSFLSAERLPLLGIGEDET